VVPFLASFFFNDTATTEIYTGALRFWPAAFRYARAKRWITCKPFASAPLLL